MNDWFDRLAARSLGLERGLQPRLGSPFESTLDGAPLDEARTDTRAPAVGVALGAVARDTASRVVPQSAPPSRPPLSALAAGDEASRLEDSRIREDQGPRPVSAPGVAATLDTTSRPRVAERHHDARSDAHDQHPLDAATLATTVPPNSDAPVSRSAVTLVRPVAVRAPEPPRALAGLMDVRTETPAGWRSEQPHVTSRAGRRTRAVDAEATPVHVAIGRVEIHAPAPQPRSQPTPRPRPSLSLDAYLARRAGSAR